MSKINIKEVVATILSELLKDKTIAKFGTDYPTTWNQFPLVIYRTADKPLAVDSDKLELRTEWNITLEIYHQSTVTQIAQQIVDRLSAVGFLCALTDANTAGLKRVICTASGVVDNATKHVYHK
ncbi:hypothetical protein [Brochothrix thermosphacta]|uniref:hypothetical protein n=1 Tax=Brochothrix thermosphacta TaxID=2756 RepID=UPI00083F92B2|nr:hypothetical protein [Brochothrix thermosphacta]ODJ54795.1 hypothetical protein BFR41_06735 [Brochothrix thermosphacta]ODJ63243.1 hypothetical protein BFR35_01290 [Brochothrix thermosphacta]ODJ66957.1 hypothetical protein BFR37_07505 [Brochothrix thermosphacta]ODJ71982.1 hypothetical protein BFR39_04385 [Brochothrix thermosphacta]